METPLRQPHVTHRASSCAKRGGHVQLCSKPGGGTRNRTRDLPKKGSAFITSSDHWTNFCWSSVIDGAGVQVEVLFVGWLVPAVHGWYRQFMVGLLLH